MFVADSEEQFRRVVREEVEAAVQKRVDPRKSASPDVDAILSYESAGDLIDRDKETIRAWCAKGLLRKYGHGKAVGVNRRELLEMMAGGTGAAPKTASPDAEAKAVLRGKNKKA